MTLRYKEWSHPAHNLTRSDVEAWRMYCSHRAKKGLPPVCYGVYKYLAAIGRQARDIAFRASQKGKMATNRKRPEWCSATTWDSWNAYRRKYNSGVTLEDWLAGRYGVKSGKTWNRSSALQRSPAEILAKFRRMGYAK
jgi:hypothetical protein